MIEGSAGIGKTSLLAEIATRGGADGLTVLFARGGELESDFGFGVLRQLLEPPLMSDLAEQLLAGAAELAKPVLTISTRPARSAPTHPVLHGLRSASPK